MENKKLFSKIYKVAKLQKVDVYVVGGFVRDNLLGIKEKKDIDFVVACSQSLEDSSREKVGLKFAKALDKELKEVGSLIEFSDFDTARYVFTEEDENGNKIKKLEIEFAGARTEKYERNSRKPIVTATSLAEDLKRRDFTVNAMAQKIGSLGNLGKIIDPFNGQEDLKNKILCTPLDPNETFSEDPLRMIRAARFAAQLGFFIEANTYEALKKNYSRLKIVSAERIKEELFKLLKTDQPSIGLRILYETGLSSMFLPEMDALNEVEEIYGQHHKNNLEHTFKVVDNVAKKTNNTLLRFAALLHDIGKPGTKQFVSGRGWTFDMHEHLGRKIVRIISKRLHFSKEESDYVAKLVRWHQQPINLMDEGVTDSAVRRLIVNLGDDLKDLLILCRSDITTGNPAKLEKRLKNYDYLEKRIEEVREKDKLRAFQSPLRGEEIMKLAGLKPGPTVGKIKKAIEEAILEGIIPNEYEASKKYFEKIKNNYLEQMEDWECLTS